MVTSNLILLHFVGASLLAVGSYALSLSPFQHPKEAFHHKHILGSDGNYTLEWKVDFVTKSIVFNVSAECKGYIGLGLSKTGSIVGSDFVVGGIDSSGKPYFSDMHGISNGTLQEDYKNDWTFLDVHREDGRIYLSFSRSFETCDEEDYPISTDLIHVIWAYGDTDEVTLFSPHHGSEPFYLLDPNLTTKIANSIYRQIGPHSNLYLMQRWVAAARQTVPRSTDSQICSIIKGPRLSLKHYILGGGAYLPSSHTPASVRQIILSRCTPENNNAATSFESFVKRDGQECNFFQNSSLIPVHLCTQIVFVWGQGGKAFYFPDEVGIPIGDSPDEYFLLEVHYHNPENLEDLKVKAGLELMFHPRPRKYEAAIQRVNYGLQGLFTVPPRSAAFSIYGHCSSQCSQSMLPKEGLDVFAVAFQMRELGKVVRLRHFRGTTELPWILKDDNYESSYQQIRLLEKSISILPGDQLTLQCTYDTSAVSHTIFSGLSANQEACVAYLFVNRQVSSAWCSSEYPMEKLLKHLGMQNLVSSRNNTVRRGTTDNTKPENILDDVDKNIRWSPSARAALQREMLHGSHSSSCPSHKQVVRSGRVRKLPVVNNYKNRKGKINDTATTTGTSFITPFAVDSVTIPNISSEYRPASECQRNSVPIYNFGFHRNDKSGKVSNNGNTLSNGSKSLTAEDNREKYKSKFTTDNFRRAYG